MSAPRMVTARSFPGGRLIGFVLVLLGGMYCLGRLYATRNSFTHYLGVDFRAVYGSSRCLIAGCNPYNSVDMRTQFLAHGGSLAEADTPQYGPFQPHYVGYPPSALFYLAPFALLPWPLAWKVFLCVGIGLYAIAALLFADLCSEYVPIAASACLGYFLAVEHDIVMLGQPTLLAAALLSIGVWCLVKNRCPRLGVLSFALSLALKPPLGGLFLLYFLIATPSYRKRALQVIGLTVILCLPALLWFSQHFATRNWVQDYKANLSGISAPGKISDPGPQNKSENLIIDLQTIVSRYRDEPSFYNPAVWIFSATVIAVWIYPVRRLRPSLEKDILCIAVIATFSMLPVYHRSYDSRALLILFPALAVLMKRTVWWGRTAAILTVLASFVLSEWYSRGTRPASRVALYLKHSLILQTAVVHIVPLILLAISAFYLVVLYVSPRALALDNEVVPARIEEPVC